MRTRSRRLIVAMFAALAVSAAAASTASAAGYWNMPSTFCQLVGCGYGGGRHAPFVLGPIQCSGYCNHNEVRLPCPPRPPYSWYGNGCGCSGPLLDPSAL